MQTSEVLVMRKLFALATLLLVAGGLAGCKSPTTGEIVQNGNSSLRLFEESSGALMDVSPGKVSLEIENASLNPLNNKLILKLTNVDRKYRLVVDKSKILADGSFELNETDLEQPIRLKGKIVSGLTEFSFGQLLGQQRAQIDIEILKGFSSDEKPMATFRTELKADVLSSLQMLSANN